MNKKLLAIAVCTCIAGSAQAVTVAGWDFSQWQEAGQLSTNGTTSTSNLPANYSAYDATFNAGAGAASFGTLYFDGSFGSTSVSQGTPSGTTAFAPTTGSPQGTGSLDSNLQGPVQTHVGTLPFLSGKPAGVGFEAFPVLEAEGQTFQHSLSMTARTAVDVVFRADTSSLTAPGEGGVGWSLSFAGKTFPGAGDSPVDVAFSTNGSSFTTIGSVNLTQTDQRFRVKLSNATGPPTENAYVRLSLDPATAQPIIDNVTLDAIYVPEPGQMLQLVSGVAGLLALVRRRARA
jgi:hypothetical protein